MTRSSIADEPICVSRELLSQDARAKVLEIFNQKMKMSPPLSDQDIERYHRLGRQTDPARPRCMIIRLKSERMRDSAYSARGFLKNRIKSP